MSVRSGSANPIRDVHELAQHFYALKDALRLEMLVLLADRDECTVNEMATALKKSQPLVSWHLRRLKAAGVVKIRRAGREVYCSIDRDSIAQHQQAFLGLIQRPR